MRQADRPILKQTGTIRAPVSDRLAHRGKVGSGHPGQGKVTGYTAHIVFCCRSLGRIGVFPLPWHRWTGNAHAMASIALSPGEDTSPLLVREDGEPLSAQGILAPRFAELALLGFALSIGLVSLLLEGQWIVISNLLLPISLMMAMAMGAYAMVSLSVAAIWTPLLWLRAAIFFYGGFGTLITVTANNDARNYIESFFQFFGSDILKYNVIVLTFVFVALVTIRILLGSSDRRTQSGGFFQLSPSALDLSLVGMIFLVAGTVANIFFIYPYQFGFVNTTYPAIIAEIAQAALIGLFLSVVTLARKRSVLLIPVVLLGLIFAAVGLLIFSKSALLMPTAMLGLAYFYLKPSFKRILIVGAAIVAVFYSSAPLVDHGRIITVSRYGELGVPVSPAERIEILRTFLDPATAVSTDENVDYATLRFSYVNVGSFVVSLRDEGRSGDTYRNAAAVFIPRAVWPDKPIVTDDARQLSLDATGNWNNSVAPGFAPEAYWNGGWLGIFLVAIGFGAVIYFWSVYNLSVQVAGAWHLFPVVLLGAKTGSRFDGFFVVDVIGPVAFALAGHAILTFSNLAILRRRDRKRHVEAF